MLIFLMLDGLALILNILAWIIIVVNVSKQSLYEALCNSPGDCPKIFNVTYVIGLTVAVVSAVFVKDLSYPILPQPCPSSLILPCLSL